MSGKAKLPASAGGGSTRIVGREKLRQIYEFMLRARRLSGGAAPHAAANRAGSGFGGGSRVLSLRVSEAAAAACAVDLRAGDCIAPHRLQALLTPAAGAPQACPGFAAANGAGRGGGSEIEGLLQEARRRSRNGGVAVAFLHPGPAHTEAWRRALRTAERLKLPILFAVEAGVDLGRPTRGRRIAQLTRGLRLPAIPVDSQDAIALYRAAHESIKRARRGGGPTLIECWRTSGRRPRQAAGEPPEPAFLRLERYMKEQGCLPNGWKSPVREPASTKVRA